jgi:hypothetical protein
MKSMKLKSLNGWRDDGIERSSHLLNLGESFQWTNVLLGLVVSTLTAAAAAQPGTLQTLINQAPEQGEVILPRGTWNEAIVIENFEPKPELVHDEPRFKDAANGNFAPTDPNGRQEQGLLDASGIKALWAKWSALVRSGQ